MRLGFAVKVLAEGGLPSHDTRRWQSGPHLRTSLGRLGTIFDYLDRVDIRMYRMATALAPYASHPDLPRFHHQVEECSAELAAIGDKARRLGLRLSTHPGQYTVLNSESEQVRDAAVADVEVQAELLDAMGLDDEAVVVLHVGGAAGGVAAGADRFLSASELLSERARARLVVENDDRVYGLADALDVSRRAGLRLVFDVHHHACHDPAGIPEQEALDLALATWPDGATPKVHFSSPRLDMGERRRKQGRRMERVPMLPDLRLHADLIDPMAFEAFLRHSVRDRELDVMLEAKGKDLALLRLRDQLRRKGIA